VCLSPTSLLLDTRGAISIARDPVKHELTKHIGVDAPLYALLYRIRLSLFSMCLPSYS
jgi:hypothetical protein